MPPRIPLLRQGRPAQQSPEQNRCNSKPYRSSTLHAAITPHHQYSPRSNQPPLNQPQARTQTNYILVACSAKYRQTHPSN
ncbi:hypothetical protein GRAN_2650 [Granulicella sibirica]|uniref:Uncharacterized protein n=1 Tax=Granulicella sibirica TaxID=2479048 RepID=A0A4Q0SXD7_9BACT|nr:hypothetical protein GRAN_2650 [Granulicella sibirica]